MKIAPSATVDGEGVDFEGVNAEFDYCEITGFSFGIKHVTASMDVRNCYIHDNSGVGIFSLFGLMKIAGDNFIADNYYAGILASGSDIFIQPFEDNPELQFTTTIQTSKALKKYAAIRLNLGAKVSVGRHHPFIPEDLALLTGESGAAAEAQLRILNNNAYRSPNYYGVQLESVSTFIGTANTSFTKTVTAGSGVGLDTTVEPAQQFVTNEGEGCQLLK
ncbi:MAG: right-handed parallel beta-helix repeat-containing protein [Deltaproteobacteria bacterium]|nr:right-handed parallel beta-helix repeat-containing protein [Deltaproteobacteria bacterium]